MMSLRSGRFGNALTWALRSRDGSFISYLADKFLQEYSKNGKLKDADLLHNLGPSMLVSDKLIFLGRYNLFLLVDKCTSISNAGKYCEFHKVYKSLNFKEAAGLLISLLASKITPK